MHPCLKVPEKSSTRFELIFHDLAGVNKAKFGSNDILFEQTRNRLQKNNVFFTGCVWLGRKSFLDPIEENETEFGLKKHTC